MSEIERDREKNDPTVNRAFTLLELLIVILLMSLMALLIFGAMSRNKPEEKHPGIAQLKRLIAEAPANGVELVCLDECSRCFFHKREEAMQPVSYQLPPVTAYSVDRYGDAIKIDFGRYRDRPVCLRFRFRSNGSSSRMIIESKGKYYYIPSFFGETEVFDDLRGAVERWRRNRDLLRNRGDYY